MGKLWTILTHLHSLAGYLHNFRPSLSPIVSVLQPTVMLLYPLYASVQAMESPSKLDDEQWLAYWILYSFITLMEMVLESLIYWIPIWYELKLLFIAWLVLPNFRGAAFIYDKFVREQLRKHCLSAGGGSRGKVKKDDKSPSSSPKDKEKPKSKFLAFVTPKKDHEAY
ncbi:HVA22-like protein e isoform X2 [Panicum virgatum]|uniref:HVA22-like protein e isoform X2 n=1 Tax=Panicum virgatum TaxID=38727 RepID=UPI0019D67AD9|nr:HVA22-like protein e isoform X2 [Panicum virgatum]